MLAARASIAENQPPLTKTDDVAFVPVPTMPARNVNVLPNESRSPVNLMLKGDVPVRLKVSQQQFAVQSYKLPNYELQQRVGPLEPWRTATVELHSLADGQLLQKTEVPSYDELEDIGLDGKMFMNKRDNRLDVWAPGIKLHAAGWENRGIDQAWFISRSNVLTVSNRNLIVWKLPECKPIVAYNVGSCSVLGFTSDRRYAVFRYSTQVAYRDFQEYTSIFDTQELRWVGNLSDDIPDSFANSRIKFSADGTKFALIANSRANLISAPGELASCRVIVFDWLTGRQLSSSAVPRPTTSDTEFSSLLPDGRFFWHASKAGNPGWLLDTNVHQLTQIKPFPAWQISGAYFGSVFAGPNWFIPISQTQGRYELHSFDMNKLVPSATGTSIRELTYLNQGDPIIVQLPPDLEPHRGKIEKRIRDFGFTIGQGNATLIVNSLALGWVEYWLQCNDGRRAFYEKKGVMQNHPRDEQLPYIFEDISLPWVVETSDWITKVPQVSLALEP